MKKIQLRNGKFAVVDDCDYHLPEWKWWNNKGYACRTIYFGKNKKSTTYLHHAIMGKPRLGLEIDHIDGDRLNNLRSNLRFVTQRQNCQNQERHRKGLTSSKYMGVSFFKRDKNWKAQININGKNKSLGYFDKEIDAFHAYQKALSEAPQ